MGYCDEKKSVSTSPADAIELANRALAFLDDRSVFLPPGSRFGKHIAALRAFQESESVDHGLLVQSFIDIHQLCGVAEQFRDCNSPKFQELLQKVVTDAARPQESKAETPGRDAQFELYLAVVLKRRGLEISFEEPDLVISASGLFIGIAAKRPKNKMRIRQRLKGAIDQLQEEGGMRDLITHGVVALDVTLVGNPKGLVGVSSGAGEPPSAALEVVEVAKNYIEEPGFLDVLMQRRRVERLTCGVLLFGAATQYLSDVGGVRNSEAMSVIRLVGGDGECRYALDQLRGTPEPI